MAKLVVDSVAEQIAFLTIDSGARKLGELFDSMVAQISDLQQRLDECCGAPLKDPKKLAPAMESTGDKPE